MGQSPDLRVGSVSLGGAQQQKHLERAAGLRGRRLDLKCAQTISPLHDES